MPLSAGIFKAYDIRGIVPATLDEEVAQALGRAFGAMARAQGDTTLAVGRDGRLSGPALQAALVRGLVASGIDVIDIGMASTPMLYFAAATLARGGVQVTASHNPKDHNGFKLVLQGRAVCGEELQVLRRAMEAGDCAPAARRGSVREHDVYPAYRDRIVQGIRLARPLKVVLDCGNGVAGASSPAILRAIGCEVVELFSEVDGRFPNHHPDPSRPENLQDVVAAVRDTDAELGLALDGDGDRLGVVTCGGVPIFPDRQLMLFARDVLSRVPGAPIVFDVKCTQRLGPVIVEAGGRPVMVRTGYTQLKAKMQEMGAPLAGEMSGHIIFGERWYGFDDGTYAACRLLEILSQQPDASLVLDALPASFATPELHVACAEGEAHRIAAELVQRARFPDAQVSTIDGVRVDWPDGFGLVRASNTNPVLTLRFEGDTREAMQRIEGEMLALLRTVKPDARIADPAH
jgi:phosphomannomutase